MDKKKTQSQKMRAVIFILWEQKGSKGNFEDFYFRYTELIINKIKEKLL